MPRSFQGRGSGAARSAPAPIPTPVSINAESRTAVRISTFARTFICTSAATPCQTRSTRRSSESSCRASMLLSAKCRRMSSWTPCLRHVIPRRLPRHSRAAMGCHERACVAQVWTPQALTHLRVSTLECSDGTRYFLNEACKASDSAVFARALGSRPFGRRRASASTPAPPRLRAATTAAGRRQPCRSSWAPKKRRHPCTLT